MPGLVLRPELAPNHVEQAFESQQLPVDKYGMPYLIHPHSMSVDDGQSWNHDHTWFFSKLPAFQDEAGEAMRDSRLQWLPREQHDRKHNLFFRKGLEWIPETEAQKFALTVMAIGGYSSRAVIDVSGNRPELVRMSYHTYNFVRGKTQLHVSERWDPQLEYSTPDDALECIYNFFASYVRKQQIAEAVDTDVLKRFLHAPDDEVRREMGDFIMGQAVDNAVQPLERDYRKVFTKGLVRPRVERAAEAVVSVFPRARWVEQHDALAEELLAA